MAFLLKAVVFDVDDTLYDQQAPFRNAVKEVSPYVLDEDFHNLYIRFRYYSDENFPKVMQGLLTIEQMRAHRIYQSLVDLDYPALTQEACLNFQKIYEDELDKIVMHEKIEEILDYLKEKEIPLAIITNGPTDHQAKKIKQLHLTQWVKPENIFISEATGYQKPDREIFELVQKSLDLAAEEIIYVGDNYDSDVAGSKKANWRSLWFNHRHRDVPQDKPLLFELEIASFEQLEQTLKMIF